MKGIILAGGTGSRLYPLTKAVSKQLLPVYDKPMIYYPLSCLMLAGVKDVLIICTQKDLHVFKKLLDDGAWLGMHFEYIVQSEPKGIAEAFIIGKSFIGKDDVVLVLGDNIFYGQSFTAMLKNALSLLRNNCGAVIFGYQVQSPEAYGVIEFNKEKKPVRIIEKPKVPCSNYVVPGIYFYDNTVIEKAESLRISQRGELEITDINNIYLQEKTLVVQLLGRGFVWLDAGTYDGLLEASNYVATIQKRQGFYIACLEEIAYSNKWITKEQLLEMAKGYKTEYGRYLEIIANM